MSLARSAGCSRRHRGMERCEERSSQTVSTSRMVVVFVIVWRKLY